MINRMQYLAWWKACTVNPGKVGIAERYAATAMKNKDRYEVICSKFGPKAPPWWLIAGLHMRESDFDFDTYLGNGQSIHRRTTIVPAGRGPFVNFEAGAIDAIKYDGLDKLIPPTIHWDIVTCLMRAEKFNGLGYRQMGRPSPYVWSFTSIYKGGKYVADHVYSSSAWDPQCGVAAMWLMLKKNHGVDLNEDLPVGNETEKPVAKAEIIPAAKEALTGDKLKQALVTVLILAVGIGLWYFLKK